MMLLLKCGVCDSIKSSFIKEQEAIGLLSKLTGIKVPIVSDLHIVNIFLKKQKNECNSKQVFISRR